MSKSPDFIIIGAMKSATTTLQGQLVQQPGIFMCEPKEPNFFSDDQQYAKGIDWYSRLYVNSPEGSLLGEASTHYSKLPNYPQTISRLKRHLSHTRFIYVMRHPIDRLISHYIHEWSTGVYSCSLEDAVYRYPELVTYGQYAMQLQPYFDAYGMDSVLPVFFDRLTSEPQMELERICRFIGYKGEPLWVEQDASNVSSNRIRRFPLYGLLVENILATWLRRQFIPKAWREKIKGNLTMRERPALDVTVRKRLENEFDRDMKELGGWLGVDLDCENFKSVTKIDSYNWI